MMGRFDEALEELEQKRTKESRSGQPTTETVSLIAFTLSRLGRYEQANQLLREGERLADRLQDSVATTLFPRLAALFAIEQGDYAGALRHLRSGEQVLQRVPSAEYRTDIAFNLSLLAAVAEMRAGQHEVARAHLEREVRSLCAACASEISWHLTPIGDRADRRHVHRQVDGRGAGVVRAVRQRRAL